MYMRWALRGPLAIHLIGMTDVAEYINGMNISVSGVERVVVHTAILSCTVITLSRSAKVARTR